MSLMLKRGDRIELYTMQFLDCVKGVYQFEDQDAYWVDVDSTLISVNKAAVVGCIKEIAYI